MHYIITGGTGFIGTHLTNLIKELNPEAQVYNLDIVKPGTPNPVVKDYKSALREGETLQSTYIECDIRKPIENLPFTPTPDDIIFNFAAVHRTPGHEDIEYFETNIRGAENVCAFAEKWGIRRIVFTSSIAPYGAAEQLKKETTLPTPNTAYGISKLVAEKIHMIWQAGGSPTDLTENTDSRLFGEGGSNTDSTDKTDNFGSNTDCTENTEGSSVLNTNLTNCTNKSSARQLLIVRPGVVFGKGENGNFTRLYWAIRGHKFAYPGRKDTIKACIYVKELVRFMMWWVANTNCTNNTNEEKIRSIREIRVQTFNCCFEPAYTIEHIVEAMKRVTGLTQWVPDVPNWVIMPMARMAMLLGSPMGICPARVKKLQISTNICGEKLKDCGYQFKWTFEEALEDWFRDNDGKGLL